ncbi:MAG TPA: shikimate kinase [Pricia sp.]|nr:shikimate kinase [Pricia sp.]
MQIVLLGYMGSGKTTVGKKLAAALELRFLDLDEYIETGEKQSIAEIFEGRGELYFRKQEQLYLLEILSQKSDFILSTGGGTPCYGDNLNILLASKAAVVYLKVPIMELVQRLVKQKAQRPLIRHIPDGELPEFIGKHLFERNNFYNRANLIIDCEAKSPEIVATEIVAKLKSQSK